MLPYGLKAAWFALSISGLVSCWVVFLAFAQVVGTHWGAIIYCLGCTILQLSFCAGMAWKMDPPLMPQTFCIAQTVLSGIGMFLMTGVVTTFSLATNLTVMKPKRWGEANKATLAWRPVYYLPIVGCPLILSIIQIALVRGLDAARPADDLHCDANNPTWVRIFGYAGSPFIASLPSLYLSLAAVVKIYKINKHLQRSRGPEVDFENLQPLPRSIQIRDPGMAPPRTFTPTLRIHQESSPVSSLVFQASHLGKGRVSPQPQSAAAASKSTISTAGRNGDDDDDTTSPTFPAFSNPITGLMPRDVQPNSPKDDWKQILTSPHYGRGDEDDKPVSLGWLGDEEVYKINTGSENGRDAVIDDLDGVFPRRYQRRESRCKRRPPPPTLAPVIWRLIIFQTTFVILQGMAFITTVVDMARPRPLPFSMQHVEMLLSAWAPLLVFGYLPVIRQRIVSWRSPR